MSRRNLYLCVGLRVDLKEVVSAAIDGGVDVVQIREKSADALPIIRAAEIIAPICQANAVPFFINDRVDIAFAVGADGVHLGQTDLPPAAARALVKNAILIGRSTHERGELDRAILEDIDYISAGPVEATPTKPGRAGTGLDYLKYATDKSPLPVFVTGGVTPERIAPLAAAGASHFVVVRYILDAENTFAAANRLRKAIDAEFGSTH